MEQDERIWLVSITRRASKQRDKLPQRIIDALEALMLDMRHDGPERLNWPHYGIIKGKEKKCGYAALPSQQGQTCLCRGLGG
ncbi:MAG: hypothetical protein LBS31_12930 [Candidatus Adiutrix sp.]|jgi:hypothetical protein|nr:hypothetical protein [Candidatus Adiutrix sp.]